MFGKKKRAPQARGQGAAAAKQMGLFVDLSPEEMMMGVEENLDDPDLEAELAALTGNPTAAAGRGRKKGKSPLPMEDIAKMADECMRDVDDDDEDDENVEDDEDLLAELQEVVGDEETEIEVPTPSTSSTITKSPQTEPTTELPQHEEVKVSTATPGSLQHTLESRVSAYKTALQNAKTAGEASKARRYDRGLKTLASMLAALKKGRPVNEAEIPPPVATGAPQPAAPQLAAPQPVAPQPAAPQPAAPRRPPPPVPLPLPPKPTQPAVTTCPPPVPVIVTPSSEEEQSTSSTSPTLSSPSSAGGQREEATVQSQTGQTDAASERTKQMLLERQREYKLAALKAKKQGDVEQAKLYFRTSKRFDAVIEALDKGQAVDLSNIPPPPAQGENVPSKGSTGSCAAVSKPPPDQNAPSAPPAAAAAAPAAPGDVLEALEQRRAKYVEASAQAKASGDDRKARMHDRIAKQYQSAIRTHKLGKAVNFDELPVPPGFPPIPGQKAAAAEQGFISALEKADQLASTDLSKVADDEDEEETEEVKPVVPAEPKSSVLDVPNQTQGRRRSHSASPERATAKEGASKMAAQQLEFLESRRKQYMKAALQAKHKNDMEQAKSLLRTAKSLDPMIQAARSGRSVDISTVPSPPGDEDDDFILVHHSDVMISEKANNVYSQLAKILKEQFEKCQTHSKQFTHLGNVTETTKFEKIAEGCKKSLEVLKLSQSKGLPPPHHHFEERSFRTVRIFPELSSTDMVVVIVKAMNLPAPSGIQANDLDAYVKFDFPYPSTDQPQKHRTAVVKNSNSPEYNQSFTLSINRNQRGFRRVVTSKGLKLELLHKGGFLRSDKPIGSALVKLDKLESQSEIREIVEVVDGRKPTGGRVEVRVRLREPLSGQDVQTSTERWLVIDSAQVLR